MSTPPDLSQQLKGPTRGTRVPPLSGGLALGELLAALTSPWKPALVAMEFQERLVVLLRLVLRDRALWLQPPALLGNRFSHWSYWQEPAALGALVRDCYEFVVIQRFQLLRRLAGCDEALVSNQLLRQVRDFVVECQRRSDPAGHGVWINGLAAVTLVADQGFVQLRGRREPLGGPTWLLFGSEEGKREAWGQLHRQSGWWQVHERLGWIDGAVQENFAAHLAQLAGQPVQPCQFRDLIAALQPPCRGACKTSSVDEAVSARLARVVAFIRPDPGFGDWEGWRFWMSRLEAEIDRLLEDPAERARCRRTLAALLWYAEADRTPPGAHRLLRELALKPRELAEDLDILERASEGCDPT